jgi:hypothetical protein
MKASHIFVIILLVVLGFYIIPKICENYISGSFDITSEITTDMDWKGSQVSNLPYYPNNLTNPPNDVLGEIIRKQSYQPTQDGPTTSTFVSGNMKNIPKINDVNNLEGFTMMNPYVNN